MAKVPFESIYPGGKHPWELVLTGLRARTLKNATNKATLGAITKRLIEPIAIAFSQEKVAPNVFRDAALLQEEIIQRARDLPNVRPPKSPEPVAIKELKEDPRTAALKSLGIKFLGVDSAEPLPSTVQSPLPSMTRETSTGPGFPNAKPMSNHVISSAPFVPPSLIDYGDMLSLIADDSGRIAISSRLKALEDLRERIVSIYPDMDSADLSHIRKTLGPLCESPELGKMSDEILEKIEERFYETRSLWAHGTVAKAGIPANCFDKIKGLFTDPNSENLVFKPDICDTDIKEIDIPVRLKGVLQQAWHGEGLQLILTPKAGYDQSPHARVIFSENDTSCTITITQDFLRGIIHPDPNKRIVISDVAKPHLIKAFRALIGAKRLEEEARAALSFLEVSSARLPSPATQMASQSPLPSAPEPSKPRFDLKVPETADEAVNLLHNAVWALWYRAPSAEEKEKLRNWVVEICKRFMPDEYLPADHDSTSPPPQVKSALSAEKKELLSNWVVEIITRLAIPADRDSAPPPPPVAGTPAPVASSHPPAGLAVIPKHELRQIRVLENPGATLRLKRDILRGIVNTNPNEQIVFGDDAKPLLIKAILPLVAVKELEEDAQTALKFLGVDRAKSLPPAAQVVSQPRFALKVPETAVEALNLLQAAVGELRRGAPSAEEKEELSNWISNMLDKEAINNDRAVADAAAFLAQKLRNNKWLK
ncbi:MAG: hypothetical protein WC632_02320 [Candidatus Margulisiibacteriota bacterium]